MDDERLIAAVAAGDHTVLRELFERHAPWLAGRLRRRLPPHAVEDVLQETFIAVWRGAGGYREGGAVGAWLWGIARRQAALWARRQGQLEVALDLIAATDPADHAAATIARADLERALARLGPRGSESRLLAELVLIEERPLAEVASRLGVPEGTVKSRLFALRRRLRAALGKDDE